MTEDFALRVRWAGATAVVDDELAVRDGRVHRLVHAPGPPLPGPSAGSYSTELGPDLSAQLVAALRDAAAAGPWQPPMAASVECTAAFRVDGTDHVTLLPLGAADAPGAPPAHRAVAELARRLAGAAALGRAVAVLEASWQPFGAWQTAGPVQAIFRFRSIGTEPVIVQVDPTGLELLQRDGTGWMAVWRADEGAAVSVMDAMGGLLGYGSTPCELPPGVTGSLSLPGTFEGLEPPERLLASVAFRLAVQGPVDEAFEHLRAARILIEPAAGAG